MRAVLAVAATGSALLFAKGARADLPPVSDAIELDGGLCFDRETLAERIQHWAKNPIDPGVYVYVTRHGSEVSFVLLRRGDTVGERALELAEATCSDTTDAVALAIAVALDANRQEAPPPKPLAAPPAPAVVLPKPRPAEPRPVSADRPLPLEAPDSEAPRSLSATGLAFFGVLAQTAPGAQVGLDWRWTRWFETHFAVFGVGDADRAPYDPTRTFTTVLLAGVIDGCAGAPAGAVRLRVCGGGAFGAVLSYTANATSIPTNGWVAPTLRLDLRVPLLRSFVLVASVDGFASLFRPWRQAFTGGGESAPSIPPLPEYGVGAGAGVAFNL
jgi:hypothetical protein